MNESKPKRKYTRRYKRGKFADDKKSSLQPTLKPAGWDPDWNAEKEKKANEEHERRFSEWVKKRSVSEDASPQMQTVRYFKITKTMEEIEQSEIPTFATVTPTVVANIDPPKERSELRVPTLERSETIRI